MLVSTILQAPQLCGPYLDRTKVNISGLNKRMVAKRLSFVDDSEEEEYFNFQMIPKNGVHESLSLCLWIKSIQVFHLAGCFSIHFQSQCPYLTHINCILPPLTTGPLLLTCSSSSSPPVQNISRSADIKKLSFSSSRSRS